MFKNKAERKFTVFFFGVSVGLYRPTGKRGLLHHQPQVGRSTGCLDLGKKGARILGNKVTLHGVRFWRARVFIPSDRNVLAVRHDRPRCLVLDLITTWIRESFNNFVAPHKRIRHLEFVDKIPKSPSGKILRRVLVDLEKAKMAAG